MLPINFGRVRPRMTIASVVGQFGFGPIIQEGSELIAVGERCATPTDSRKTSLTLKGSYCRTRFAPFRVGNLSPILLRGRRKRSPTAIDLNPIGIRKHIESDLKLKLTHNLSLQID